MIFSPAKLLCYSVLVVDPHLDQNLHAALDQGDFRVNTVHTAAEAAGLDGFAPHLILAALNLQDTCDLDLLRQIKARLPQIPLIIVSEHCEDACLIESLCLGSDDLIIRPFRPRDLLKRINRALARSYSLGALLQSPTGNDHPLPASAPFQDLDHALWLQLRHLQPLGV